MKSTTFTYKDQDDVEIFVYKWEPDQTPKAVVQISHGLAEHAARYTHVAEALCNANYICYADDHRGHGRTAGDLTEATLEGNAGNLGPNGWKGTLNSIHELTNIIKKENPNLPVFFLGHSWGSFLGQNLIQEWGAEYKGCIMSGTNGKMGKILIKAGRGIAKKEIKKHGPNAPSEKMDRLSFKAYSKPWKKEPGATKFEWLSRDKEVVNKYIADPWCGFISPGSLFLEMLTAFLKIWDESNERKIPKDLPIYFISGSEDPVSLQTKNLMPIIERYKEYGIKDVTYKIYENGRHEMFNEINKEEVLQDVINWFNSHL